MKLTSLLLAVALFASMAYADDLVVTSASVAPTASLPGLPVWISITVRNVSTRSASLPLSYAIEVTPSSGEPFMARQLRDAVALLPAEYKHVRELGAGESRTIDFVTGGDIGDGWSGDRRLWQAGTYQLRLILSDELRNDDFDRMRWTDLAGSGRVAVAPVVTPAIELAVARPTGVDADAWAALMAATDGVGLLLNQPKGGELGEQLWTRFRGSRYAPYFGLAAGMKVLRSGAESRFLTLAKLHDEVVASDRDGLVTDSIRLGRAEKTAYAALNQSDVDRALSLTAEARQELQTLTASKHELTRLHATGALAALPSDGQTRERLRR
jgi:hypothetical protein